MGLTLKENGLLYTLLLSGYYGGSGLSNLAFERMQTLRKKKGLPGLNSRSLNTQIWDDWDWQAGGDEWTPSPEWKSSLVKSILLPNVPQGSRIVEIGPGAGRWTEHLIPLASEYQGIDISSKCVEICSAKFAAHQNATFRTNDGNNLPGVADASIDVIWSFDVFVHINLADIATYLDEFKRVLKPGGVAIIHHGTTAGHSGGWRSDATTAELNDLIVSKGLVVKAQFGDWEDDGKRFEVGLYQDQVTVISKPA
ncbi:class I SAM-dependent methyltransferase [Phragmitibacter flavus]|uniref:Class I SAM-dependent methyltransferase n=1 Tax=Phragmitibacter flavus TaxID=2576071 RepID=A0A5R8KAD4_9BACT|nr:class I SAM-dependent methyltransferase [Phragmitibacter flavus]TLD69254.1 class I SAM-dependent methyltransferase [Phragmitibacter flavus]